MIKRGLILCLLFLASSCFNNKIKEIKHLSFDELIINKNASQVNSGFLGCITTKDFGDFLLKNNFKNKDNQTEFIFSEKDATYKVIIDGNEKLKSIEFYSYSKLNSLEKALVFFKQAAKISIPQTDTLKIKTWTEGNMKIINEKFSRATILSNIHYIIEQISLNEFKLTIKKYNS
jgi:hypothetical protein